MTQEIVPDETREIIIQAVDKLYRLYGYKKTSVEDIAIATNLSRSTIYLHFHSKEDIALSWAEQFTDRIFQNLRMIANQCNSPSEKLRELLNGRIMLRLRSVLPYHKSVDDILAAIRYGLIELKARYQEIESSIFVEVLRQGKELGEFDFKDAKETSMLLLLSTNALLPSNLDPDLFEQPDQVELITFALTDLLIGGLRTRK